MSDFNSSEPTDVNSNGTDNSQTDQGQTDQDKVNQDWNQDGQTDGTDNSTQDKGDDVERNKKIALQQEREKRKNAEDELAQYKAREAEAIQKEKIKKGKYEEVIAEKDAELAAYKEKAEKYDAHITKQTELNNAKIEELKGSLDEGILAANQDFLEDMWADKQIRFLESLQSQSKKQDFGSKPDNKQAKPDSNDQKFSQQTTSSQMIWAMFGGQFGNNK